jgi:hypothetical protein
MYINKQTIVSQVSLLRFGSRAGCGLFCKRQCAMDHA